MYLQDAVLPVYALSAPHQDPVLAHRGYPSTAYALHLSHVRSWLRGLAPAPTDEQLMERLSDGRMLRTAAGFLKGTAAGPDGVRPDEVCDSDLWQLCRALSCELRDQTYRPQPPLKHKQRKAGGEGFRTLHIANLRDRVVGATLAQMVGPILEPTLLPLSFGLRQGDGCHRAVERDGAGTGF